MSKLGLLISTCQHYFSNIPNIIKDIEECGFPKENVLIVSGQENSNSIYYQNDIKIVKVNYTGLHLTGVVYVCENMDSFKNIDYWIILPDTIKLEKKFYANVLEYYNTYLNNSKVLSLPFINPRIRQSMDMGIVHISHIVNMSDYLNKIKKAHPCNEIIQLKNQLILDENTILGLRAVSHEHSTKFTYINELNPTTPDIFITNNKNELIERLIISNNRLLNEVYFTKLGIYKYQRNFRGPGPNLIMEL